MLFGEYHIGGSFRGWAKQIVPWRKSKMQGTQFYPAVAGLPLLSKSLLTKDWHFSSSLYKKTEHRESELCAGRRKNFSCVDGYPRFVQALRAAKKTVCSQLPSQTRGCRRQQLTVCHAITPLCNELACQAGGISIIGRSWHKTSGVHQCQASALRIGSPKCAVAKTQKRGYRVVSCSGTELGKSMPNRNERS